MQITNTFYAPDRQTWRAWLENKYREEEEIWLIFYRKAAGMPNVSYNDAVEEALCFGWIDSIRKGLNDEALAHRFTPRKAGSGFSQTNIERLRRLNEQGKVSPDVLPDVEPWLVRLFEYPGDILEALKEDPEVWRNFSSFSPAYQRIRVAFVHDGRKRKGEFEKRLANLLKKTKRNKQFGYGIEAYY